MRKHTEILLLLALFLLALCACTGMPVPEEERTDARKETVQTEESKENVEEEDAEDSEEEEDAEKEQGPDPMELYAPVLDQYKEQVASGWHDIGGDNYPYVSAQVFIGPIYSDEDVEKPPIYFAVHDLDDNGVPELFVGAKNEDSTDYWMLDLFTYDGTAPINPITGETCAFYQTWRGQYFVTEDGRIVAMDGTGGTFVSCAIYRLSDSGCLADPVEELIQDSERGFEQGKGEALYLRVDANDRETEISREAYEKCMREIESAPEISLDWKPLSEYRAPSVKQAESGGKAPEKTDLYPADCAGMKLRDLKLRAGEDLHEEERAYDDCLVYRFEKGAVPGLFWAEDEARPVGDLVVWKVFFQEDFFPPKNDYRITPDLTTGMHLDQLRALDYPHEFIETDANLNDVAEGEGNTILYVIDYQKNGKNLSIQYSWFPRGAEGTKRPDPNAEPADRVIITDMSG